MKTPPREDYTRGLPTKTPTPSYYNTQEYNSTRGCDFSEDSDSRIIMKTPPPARDDSRDTSLLATTRKYFVLYGMS